MTSTKYEQPMYQSWTLYIISFFRAQYVDLLTLTLIPVQNIIYWHWAARHVTLNFDLLISKLFDAHDFMMMMMMMMIIIIIINKKTAICWPSDLDLNTGSEYHLLAFKCSTAHVSLTVYQVWSSYSLPSRELMAHFLSLHWAARHVTLTFNLLISKLFHALHEQPSCQVWVLICKWHSNKYEWI